MKYYELIYDYENDSDAVVCDISEQNELDMNQFELGFVIDDWNEEFSLYYNPSEGDYFTDYLGNSLGLFVISSRLKEILELVQPGGIQYLPIVVKSVVGNRERRDYVIANIINVIEALDFENSIYNEWVVDDTHKILAFELHALKRNAIEHSNVFRLKEDILPIFLSEKTMQLICEKNITGCDFSEIRVV